MEAPFTQGARAAGEAAGRAVFQRLRQDWVNAVAGLDTIVESRAIHRGASQRMLAEAQSAALDGLEATFDNLFTDWAAGEVATLEAAE